MKYAIFSDVQGNYEALRRFFNQVSGRVDKYLCLGVGREYNDLEKFNVDVIIEKEGF